MPPIKMRASLWNKFKDYIAYKRAQPTHKNQFHPAFFKKNYACIPLVTLMICDLTYMCFSGLIALFTSDCQLTRAGGPDVNYDLLIHGHSKKLMCITQEFDVQQELYDTYQDMIQAEKELKQQQGQSGNNGNGNGSGKNNGNGHGNKKCD